MEEQIKKVICGVRGELKKQLKDLKIYCDKNNKDYRNAKKNIALNFYLISKIIL